MQIWNGNYPVLADNAGKVIPFQLTATQANNGIAFDVSFVGSAPAGVFGNVKGATIDLTQASAGSVVLSSPDLAGWTQTVTFGGFTIINVPGTTTRVNLQGTGITGQVALILWNTTPPSQINTLANLNATVQGSTSITALGNVNITNPQLITQHVALDTPIAKSGQSNLAAAGNQNVILLGFAGAPAGVILQYIHISLTNVSTGGAAGQAIIGIGDGVNPALVALQFTMLNNSFIAYQELFSLSGLSIPIGHSGTFNIFGLNNVTNVFASGVINFNLGFYAQPS